jgi:8-amino-7-oxononanoate synthase
VFHVKQPSTPQGLAFLDGMLEAARGQGLLRDRRRPAPALLSFCSNDYLGLARQLVPAAESGAGASRLVDGDRPIHSLLEEAAASLVKLSSALVFTSGYAANVGLLSALAGPEDLIVSDALNHASIIDGARLSRARVTVTPHLDVDAVDRALRQARAQRAFVVTESYFSMDADSPDLAALRRICDQHGAALLVDEAHALGVLGPEGRGLCAAAGVAADAVIGTFGKAFGAGGAFVAGCPALTQWLWNRARSFVFSTGLSPAVAAAALEGMRTASAEPERRERTAAAAHELREGLARRGVRSPGFGHIVPWVVGDARDAVAASERLAARGFDVRAIRPPSVPKGTARLRLTVSAGHSPEDVAGLLAAIQAVREEQSLTTSPADT